MKALVSLLCVAALVLPGCLAPNTSVTDRAEELRAWTAAMQDAGVEGRAVVIWGTGHVAGQAFNISGSSGYVEVTVEPAVID